MGYPKSLILKVQHARRRGYSLNEISKDLGISKATASIWCRDVELSQIAKVRLNGRRRLGRLRAALTKRNMRLEAETVIAEDVYSKLKTIRFDNTLHRLLGSILFWAEGGKSLSDSVAFINSDPEMIKVFLINLRKSFVLDEGKFRALIHIHEYHDDQQLKAYWSKLTDIPVKQFSKSYLKTNSGPRRKNNYMGCLRIRYYDARIALELRTYYNMYSKLLRDVG